MRNFQQPGDVVTLTAPVGGVTGGLGYQIGQLFVVAAATVAAGLPFEGEPVGVFQLVKIGAQAWTVGALIYWDAGNSRCTTVAAGNLLIGVCVEAVGNGAGETLGKVRLNGYARANEAP